MRRAQLRMVMPAEVDLVAFERGRVENSPFASFAGGNHRRAIEEGLHLPEDVRLIHFECDLLMWRLIALLEGDGLPKRYEWTPGHEPVVAAVNPDGSIHL